MSVVCRQADYWGSAIRRFSYIIYSLFHRFRSMNFEHLAPGEKNLHYQQALIITMGNRSSKVTGSPDLDDDKTIRRRSGITVPEKEGGELQSSWGWDVETKTDATTMRSEYASTFKGSISYTITVCPTQLPPPRTMEGARDRLQILSGSGP